MQSIALRLHRRLQVADLFLVLVAIPIFVLFALAPETFGLSWAGRGGFLFVLFFLWFELLDIRKTASVHLTRTRKVACALLIAFVLLYFVANANAQMHAGQYTGTIYWAGVSLGIPNDVINSWLMAMDYLVLTSYVIGLATAFFGARAVLWIITPVVFSTGMFVLCVLDAFMPYGTIGPLQFWANFIVASVAFLSRVFGLPIYGYSNNLTIVGQHGTYRLIVFWPSVGVHSMLIYSLVMVLIAVKLNAPSRRKLTYAVVGVAGTLFLNVTRIFLISYYAYLYATSAHDLDAFHNSIGEILLPLWIVAFLIIVLNIERRLSTHVTSATTKPQGLAPTKSNPSSSQPNVAVQRDYDKSPHRSLVPKESLIPDNAIAL